MAHTIDKLIINSPYQEPQKFWSYNRERRTFHREDGRRPAGYVIASQGSKSFDDPGIFVEIELVNKIRPRVKKWVDDGCQGVTGITKRLLNHWNDIEERKDKRLFFCQLEAIQTLIWLVEGPDAEKVGIEVPSDGGEFRRLCSKMATGSGKTIVMAMLIAWQILNKVTYGQDKRFSKNVLVIAPGLTVKNRLDVLKPFTIGNYYEEFNIVPQGLYERLRQGNVLINNWHVLQWNTEERIAKKKSVDKRGAKSDEAYVREVLGAMANAQKIVVINDEAHHAWRVPAESKIKGVKKEDIEESTIWIGGLDRIHRTKRINTCYDFSATPFAPSGKKSSEEALFEWIVSDFGLNDAIESGLVKTPRVVIRDDGKKDSEFKSRLYHIYMDYEVKDDLNRKGAEETEPLPDLVTNAYYLLGKDWIETKKEWEKAGHKIPPVMITVANRTETSARIKYSFDHNAIQIPELCIPGKTLHIDSKVLEMAEAQNEGMEIGQYTNDESEEQTNGKKLTKKQQAELLRKQVDTVGKPGKLGEQIQNVISVGMLQEGWDAKNVTHIMGIRAFSSQLLCEQVVGRGLRRTCYDIGHDGLFEPEYVNIFGVPFTFLPHEGGEGAPPPPPKPKTQIEPVGEKKEHEVSWPNILRINHVYKPVLQLDLNKVTPIELDPYESITSVELAAIIEGKTSLAALTEIDLKEIGEKFRLQKIIFEVVKNIFNNEKPNWKGQKENLLGQLIKIVGRFIYSDKIVIKNNEFRQDDIKRRILIMLNMNKVVQHIWSAIRNENRQTLESVFDPDYPIRSTVNMRTWYTSKPCEWAERSHINFCVMDSAWEASEAYRLDKHGNVKSWVKNDHLGFEIVYNFQGVIRKFRPDFIILLKNGEYLILETKGQDNQQNRTKREFLDEWVKAVNIYGGFGKWNWAVSFHPSDLEGILDRYV